MWALMAHHLVSMGELSTVVLALAGGFLISAVALQRHFGLDPSVSRREPRTALAQARLTRGKIRVPLVGRDILIGTTYGVLLGVFESADNILVPLFGGSPPQPGTPSMESLMGVRPTVGSIFGYTWIYVLFSLGVFF